MEEYLEAMSDDMQSALEALENDLLKVRTGRATPKLVDGVQVQVQAYGAVMPLNQLATVNAPDPRLLVITPWDKSTITDIERGIVQAGLGLNPSNDGQVIRVPVPALTSDRRQELVRQVRKIGEDAKIRVRHVRREYNDIFKQAEKDGELPEDTARKMLDKVQSSTDANVKKVDAMVEAKEAEVSEV